MNIPVHLLIYRAGTDLLTVVMRENLPAVKYSHGEFLHKHVFDHFIYKSVDFTLDFILDPPHCAHICFLFRTHQVVVFFYTSLFLQIVDVGNI